MEFAPISGLDNSDPKAIRVKGDPCLSGPSFLISASIRSGQIVCHAKESQLRLPAETAQVLVSSAQAPTNLLTFGGFASSF